MRRPPIFFQETPRKGRPISLRGLADGLAKLERAVSRQRVLNGHVDWWHGIPTIVTGEDVTGGSVFGHSSWEFYRDIDTADNVALFRDGLCYYQGISKTVSNVPSSVTFTSSGDDNLFYVKLTFSTASAEWLSTTGTFDAAGFPNGTQLYEIFPISEFSLDTDGTILDCKQHARGTVLSIPGVSG